MPAFIKLKFESFTCQCLRHDSALAFFFFSLFYEKKSVLIPPRIFSLPPINLFGRVPIIDQVSRGFISKEYPKKSKSTVGLGSSDA